MFKNELFGKEGTAVKPDVLKDAARLLQSETADIIPLAKKKYSLLQEPVCRRWQLTKTELDILLFLSNNPTLDRAADIVSIRQIAKSHVSLSVSNLEQRGFLTRVYDPEDRRTAHLKLTQLASPVLEEGGRIQREYFSAIFSGLTQEELSLWRGILDRVCGNIRAME